MPVAMILPVRVATIAGVLSLVMLIGAQAFAAGKVMTITNFAFQPMELKVPAGTTVIFRNDDDSPHSVVADDESFHSDALDTGDTYTQKLVAAGIVAIHCGLHPFMQAKITVE